MYENVIFDYNRFNDSKEFKCIIKFFKNFLKPTANSILNISPLTLLQLAKDNVRWWSPASTGDQQKPGSSPSTDFMSPPFYIRNTLYVCAGCWPVFCLHKWAPPLSHTTHPPITSTVIWIWVQWWQIPVLYPCPSRIYANTTVSIDVKGFCRYIYAQIVPVKPDSSSSSSAAQWINACDITQTLTPFFALCADRRGH